MGNFICPGEGREPIYEYITKHLQGFDRLPEGFYTLPDDDVCFEDLAFRWMPGGIDGVLILHGGFGEEQEEQPCVILDCLLNQIRNPSVVSRGQTCQAIIEYGPIWPEIDRILHGLVYSRPEIDHFALYQEACWMARDGTYREVVKLGLAILGLYKSESHKDLLNILGLHDEFGWYVAPAAIASLEDPETLIFHLAQRLDGWGKIAMVRNLKADRPEIMYWLLTEGCRNTVMNEYLAYTCAVKGNLKDALDDEYIDHSLYRGAGTIIAALLENGSPAETIENLGEDASTIIMNYLRHAQIHCYELDNLLVLNMIGEYFTGILSDPDNAFWDKDTATDYIAMARAIILKVSWYDDIKQNLNDIDGDVNTAVLAARVLGMDIWNEMWLLLNKKPQMYSLYYSMLEEDSKDRISQVIDFAQDNLLDHLQTGETDENNSFGEWELCMTFVLQTLRNWPGLGQKLVIGGLRSDSVRLKHQAIRVLGDWSVHDWPAGAMQVVDKMAEDEKYRVNIGEVFERQGVLSLEKREILLARDFFRRALDAGINKPGIWFNWGLSYHLSGDFEEAAGYYEKAVQTDPVYYRALVNLAVCRTELGEYQEAVDCLNRAVEIKPAYSHTWFNLGYNLVCLERYAEAVACYDRAMELYQYDYRYPCNKAQCLNLTGEYEDALFWADRALFLNSDDEIAWCNKAFSLMHLQRHDEAVRCYEIYLKLHPDDYKSWYDMGFCMQNLGRFREAISCYRRALQLDSSLKDAWDGVGQCLISIGKTELGEKCLKRGQCFDSE